MCLRFIRTHTFSFCSFGSFVLDVGSCFRCVCARVCSNVCHISKISYFFSFFFPFPFHIIFFIHISLFEIFFYRGSCFVVKHITFNRTLCSVCVFVRAEWAKCFCAQCTVAASLKNRFRYCFLPTSTHVRVSCIDEFDQTEFSLFFLQFSTHSADWTG